MDSWKRFNKILLSDKEDFFSNLNMENITDGCYKYAKNVWKNFEIKIFANTMIQVFKVIHYCLHMYLKTFEIIVLKYRSLILVDNDVNKVHLKFPFDTCLICLKFFLQ